MLPLYDINPTQRKPIVTVSIIVICVVVFILELAVGLDRAVSAYGAIPYELLSGKDISPRIPVPVITTAFTSMFMHGGLLHLGFNMLYLWIFGNNVEDYLGHLGFLIFYIVTGLAALASHIIACIVFGPSKVLLIPTVGASGAISGVLGAYIYLYPDARVLTLVPLGLFWTTMELPALVVIGIWAIYQLINGLIAPVGSSVAWFAHIGGFVAGLVIIIIIAKFRRPQREYIPELPHEYYDDYYEDYTLEPMDDGYLDIW